MIETIVKSKQEKHLSKVKSQNRDTFDEAFLSQVYATRFVVACLLLFGIYHHEALNSYTQVFWSWLRLQWWFKHDSFEPIWATFSFSVHVNIFSFIDKKCASFASPYLINPKSRDAKAVYKENLNRAASTAYLLPILLFDAFYPRRNLPLSAPGFFEVCAGVAVGIWLYDLIFFPIHLAMHKIPFLYKNFHARHHENTPLVSADVIRHSFVDGSLQVIANILTLNILGLHPLSRMMYNFVITYMLTETHSGYNMPWMLHNIVPGNILGGSVRHEMHHRTGRNNYHQFFTYFDDMFGYGSGFRRTGQR